jgi:hypothetical protein
MVKVYVGPERKLWTLPEHVLCKIDYFKAAFKSGFKEGAEKEIDMPEDDPSTFGHLVDWLFCDSFTNAFKRERQNPNNQLILCNLWLLADKLSVKELVKSTIKEMETVIKFDKLLAPETVDFFYKNTTKSLENRKQFVELAARRILDPDEFDESEWTEVASCNLLFSADVMKKIRLHLLDGKNKCKRGYGCSAHSDPDCYC